MAPQEARFVALADQDDRWHPDKLATLVALIGEAPLIYSDARLVDRDGAVQSDTYWSSRHNNHSDLLSLLVANAVTLEGEQVRPQPGGFYGGWITDEVVGPFKGGPGTWGW